MNTIIIMLILASLHIHAKKIHYRFCNANGYRKGNLFCLFATKKDNENHFLQCSNGERQII